MPRHRRIDSTYWISQNITGMNVARVAEAIPHVVTYPLGTINSILYMASNPDTWTLLCRNPHFIYPFANWVNTLWNYTNGVCALITGFHQWSQGEYSKGLVNLFNGSQLILVGYFAASFASCSLALAMFYDLINATIDWYKAYVRHKEYLTDQEHNLSDANDLDFQSIQFNYQLAKKNVFFKLVSFLGITAIAVPSLLALLGSATATVATATAICNPIGAIAILSVATYYLFFKPAPIPKIDEDIPTPELIRTKSRVS